MNCTCCGAQLHANEHECRFCGEPSIQEHYVPRRPVREPVQPDHIYRDEQSARAQRPEHIYVEHHYVREKSDKSRVALMLLCLFLGRYGAHKFYLGKVGSGVAYLLTHGWAGIGWVIDMLTIAFGNPVDAQGRPIRW